MALVELSIIMSFPKRFKYSRSVSMRIGEMTPTEESQSDGDRLYCLPRAKVASHNGISRGMSSTFPMTGKPFGPGGRGRDRLLLRFSILV